MKRKLIAGIALIAIGLALFGGIRSIRAQKKSKPPYLTIYGHPGKGNGLSQQSADLVNALKGDLSVHCIATQKPRSTEKIPSNLRPFLKKSLNPKCQVVLFNETLWTPNRFDLFQNIIEKSSDKQIKISYSMFDATSIPHEWVFILNNYFDAVAVPNMFLADVYQKSGVTIPIFEVPYPMDLTEYLKQPPKEKAGTPFVFGNFSACEDKNNHLILITAFAKAFGNRSDVQLRINTDRSEKLLRQLLQWEIDDMGLKNVLFTELQLDPDSYFDQFTEIDCYVSLSKGEGFSYQPTQALALGIPVIVTNNTAQAALCETGLVRSVAASRVQLARHASLNNVVCGKYFNCDVAEVAVAMADVFSNYSSYLKKAKEARVWAAQWDVAHVKNTYLNLIKPKTIVLGDENKVTEDTLVTTCPALYKKYKSL